MNLTPDRDYTPDIDGHHPTAVLEESAPAGGSFRASGSAAPGIKVKSSIECLTWADGEMIAQMNEVFRSEWKVKAALAAAKQSQAMTRLGANRKSLEGIGRVRCEIDEELAAMLRAQYGHDCLVQPDFLKFLERQYPHLFRVQCTGTRTQVGWSAGMKAQPYHIKRASLAAPSGIIPARN